MPSGQAMIARVNPYFTSQGIQQLNAQTFAPGADLVKLASDHQIAQTQWERDIIAAIPTGIQEMIRALVYSNLNRSKRLSITWAWAPGYDYELNVWECPGTAVSPGGITVVLRTRYPLDTHPSTISIKTKVAGARAARGRAAGRK